MRSSWSLGVVFIALGGIAVSPIGAHQPLTPVGVALAALLVIGGVALVLQRPFALWVALAAAGAAVLTGVVALAGHPRWALPVPAPLSIGVGLYLILRTFMARGSLGHKPRGFLPRDDDGEPAARDDEGEGAAGDDGMQAPR